MKFNVRSTDIPLSSPLSLYYAANVFFKQLLSDTQLQKKNLNVQIAKKCRKM